MKRIAIPAASSLILALCAVNGAPSARARDADNDAAAKEVDTLFARWDRPDSPGAAVAVIREGEVLYKKGFGCADLEHGIPITSGTVFDIAPVSKQFAGMAVAMLVEDGKVSLDDDIGKHLPEVPDFGHTITVRHLVHHTSGLRDWPGTLAFGGRRFEDVIAFHDILEMVKRQEDLNFEPGAEYSYSNTGYNLLAEMVSRVEGLSFREWTDRNIFQPLEMENTHFHDDHREVVKNRACSYSPDGRGGFVKITNNLTAMGSSSLYTTIDDLVKWVKNFDDGRVGGRAVIARMKERGVLNSGKEIDYAFGQAVKHYRGIETVSHSGGWAGFRTRIVRCPDLEFSIIVLSNLSTVNVNNLVTGIADIYLADLMEPAEPAAEQGGEKTVEIDPGLLDDYTGTWELGPAWLLTVFRQKDGLMAQATGEGAFPMAPVGDDRFFVQAYGAAAAFERDAAGAVGEILYKGIRAKRVEPFCPSVHRLKEYEGDFRSAELDAVITIEVRGDVLAARYVKFGAFKLSPATADLFKAPGGRLEFFRGAGGWVAGFRYSEDRSRNIRFDRVPLTDAGLEAARRDARFRERRIIMNNDGNDDPAEPVTPRSFLDSRTTPLQDSHVDSIFYCTGVVNLYSHRSAVSEQMGSNWDHPGKEWVKALNAQDTDSLEIMIGWGKDHGREIFWSLRMNDRHDTSPKSAHLLCRWKRDHPELLMGKLGDRFPFGGNSWSAMRYGRAEVRAKMFRILEDVCARYDVDGIELDFFRHPVYFIEAAEGKPVPREKIEAMTSLMRRVRAMTAAVGRRRGRPLLTAIRIPDSLGYCLAMGLDVRQWLAEGLIDIVSGGGYFKLEPWQDLATLGREYGVPVYAAFVRRRIENASEPEGPTALEVWRGEALMAWRAGVNGIYTFNRFVPDDPIFRELGDPALLETLDRVERTAYDEYCTWSRPQTWVKDGNRFVKRPERGGS